ncbi:MAG: RNA polymerase sigma factor [Chloroflexota bacterium]
MGAQPERRGTPVPAYAQNLIRIKARQLSQKRGFRRHEREDLIQELTLRLLTKLPNYDPARASLDTFCDRVIISAVKMLIRDRRRLCRAGDSSTVSLEGQVALVGRHPVPMREALGEDDRLRRLQRKACDPELTQGVRELLEALPADQRRIAGILMHAKSVKAAADEAGIARTTLYKHLRLLRQRFSMD